MRKTALLLAMVFTLTAPGAVIGGAAAQPESVIVFNMTEAPQNAVEPTVSTEDVEVMVGVLDMYMTPGVSDPVTDLVFGGTQQEDVPEQEAVTEEIPEADAEEETVAELEEEVSADESLDKGFVSSGVIDSSKPVLQKPSGTLANGASSVSKYKLTDTERELVERVIMAEVSGSSYTDALAVAQCIYDRAIKYGDSVHEVIYAKNAFADPSYRYNPTSTVKKAVSHVFDDGIRLTVEPLLYFYATRSANPGAFHETQRCLVETSMHRYFGPW